MKEEVIYVHHIAVVKEVLGEGERLVVWTTGCPFHCKGCIEEKLQKLEYGTPYEVNYFYKRIEPLLLNLKAITFSGGEPLFQKNALLSLLKLIPKDVDVMLFTGNTTKIFNTNYKDFHQYIDIVVTEPFVLEKHSNHLYRGSSNQKIISPSGKHNDKIDSWMNSQSKGMQIEITDNDFFIYGIPVPNTLENIEKILKEKGIVLEEQ